MACAQVQYTAVNGLIFINTANSNRDGSGTVTTCLTAGGDGVAIQSMSIKAVDSTSQGMIRFYIDNGSTINLLKEVVIPAVTATAVVPTFEISLNGGFDLLAGYKLRVSTQIGEGFVIFIDGMQWNNCEC